MSTRERLHKYLARAGVGSRRTCEEYILQGRVTVDKKLVTRLGTTVDPEREVVRFDDEIVRAEAPAYYLVYKPKGVVCTTRDQFRRTSVVDLVRDRKKRRLFPVGRLEEDSEGLIIVTNDGSLAHKIADHKKPLRHTYFVRVRGRVGVEQLEKVRQGVWLSDGRTSPMHVKILRSGKKVSTLLVTPSAHQHRQLRRAMAKVGMHVDRVVRVRLGPLTTHGLKKGEARVLDREELALLLSPRVEDLGPMTGGVRRRAPSRPGGREARRPSSPVKRRKPRRGGVKVRARAERRRREDPPADERPRRRLIGP